MFDLLRSFCWQQNSTWIKKSKKRSPFSFLISRVAGLVGYYFGWEIYHTRPVNSHSKYKAYRENTQSYTYEDVEDIDEDKTRYYRIPSEEFYNGDIRIT